MVHHKISVTTQAFNPAAAAEIADKYRRALELQRQNQLGEAATLLHEILATTPRHYDALQLLGVIQLIGNQNSEAEANLSKAAAIKQTDPLLYYNLGLCLDRLGKKAEAVESYSKAIALNPKDFRSLNNRGKTLCELGRAEQSLADCDAALALKPDYAAALNNRGAALRGLKRNEEALASYEQSLQLAPNAIDTLYNQANLLRELARFEASERAFTKLHAVAPDYHYVLGNIFHCRLQSCKWDNYDAYIQGIISGLKQHQPVDNPFSFLAYSSSAADQLECAQTYIARQHPASAQPLWNGERYQHAKIKVAYLSADFHHHATAYLMAELFEIHDRSRFEIIAISFGPQGNDSMRDRLRGAFDQFLDVNQNTDLEVAQLIRDMEIDIAVDLKGFTFDNRTGIFAHRPAPIQINYLGHPGTLGADYFDYIIADHHLIPQAHQAYYAERIIYMPDTYQVNDSTRQIAQRAPSRTEAGLPEQGFVFCCFNNNYKISPLIFAIWMRLLKTVDGSVLWLLQANGAAPENLRKEAARHGVDPARLIFAPRARIDEHLARHRLADLFLDTLPYNAHTTTSDALWAGLPVLTCQGNAFPGRVAASLLYAAGLPQLVTQNLDDYAALALSLATDKYKLDEIRNQLLLNRSMCPLFDTQGFRMHIESAYRTIWQRNQDGLPPVTFDVKAEP